MVSQILIAVCLSLTSDPGEEKGVDFLQKSNVPPVTPGIPPTPSLQNRIYFFKLTGQFSRSKNQNAAEIGRLISS